MIFRREHLGQHPAVFRSLTGLTVTAFDRMLPGLLTPFAADRRRRLDRPGRRRAFGGADDFDLGVADQFLLAVVWLRHYPTQECLAYLFGVSDSTALRAARRCLPVLEAQGRDSLRLPDPGKGQRRDLPALLRQTPELAVIIDTFEQRTHRPQRRQRAYYSGKKGAGRRRRPGGATAELPCGHFQTSLCIYCAHFRQMRRGGKSTPNRAADLGRFGVHSAPPFCSFVHW
jgi:hypothetical protein